MLSLIRLRRTRPRTLALPIHPCVELSDWVGTVLMMAWDGELPQADQDRLFEQIRRDPAAAAYAEQIRQDEALMRSAFGYLEAARTAVESVAPTCAA